jgi:hypothetical protein
MTYRPSFYRPPEPPGPARHERAGEFVERTLQLRNDAANEERWEAVFTEDQVNAWLAEDLPTQFPEMLPASIREPRIVFEADRATLAFTYEEGLVRGVLWAVLRVEVGEENEVSIEVEKLRMGLIPIPDGLLVDRIRGDAGVPLTWDRPNGRAQATVRVTPRRRGRSVRIEDVQVAKGWLRIAGRTEGPGAGVQVESVSRGGAPGQRSF